MHICTQLYPMYKFKKGMLITMQQSMISCSDSQISNHLSFLDLWTMLCSVFSLILERLECRCMDKLARSVNLHTKITMDLVQEEIN